MTTIEENVETFLGFIMLSLATYNIIPNYFIALLITYTYIVGVEKINELIFFSQNKSK